MSDSTSLKQLVPIIAFVTLALCSLTGCNEQSESPSSGSQNSGAQTNGNTITSNEAITVNNGKVTIGELKITEEDEKQIYKSLSSKRNLAKAVPKENVKQQLMQEYDLIKKGFMSKFKLTEADIEAILKKGDDNGWK